MCLTVPQTGLGLNMFWSPRFNWQLLQWLKSSWRSSFTKIKKLARMAQMSSQSLPSLKPGGTLPRFTLDSWSISRNRKNSNSKIFSTEQKTNHERQQKLIQGKTNGQIPLSEVCRHFLLQESFYSISYPFWQDRNWSCSTYRWKFSYLFLFWTLLVPSL